ILLSVRLAVSGESNRPAHLVAHPFRRLRPRELQDIAAERGRALPYRAIVLMPQESIRLRGRVVDVGLSPLDAAESPGFFTSEFNAAPASDNASGLLARDLRRRAERAGLGRTFVLPVAR